MTRRISAPKMSRAGWKPADCCAEGGPNGAACAASSDDQTLLPVSAPADSAVYSAASDLVVWPARLIQASALVIVLYEIATALGEIATGPRADAPSNSANATATLVMGQSYTTCPDVRYRFR